MKWQLNPFSRESKTGFSADLKFHTSVKHSHHCRQCSTLAHMGQLQSSLRHIIFLKSGILYGSYTFKGEKQFVNWSNYWHSHTGTKSEQNKSLSPYFFQFDMLVKTLVSYPAILVSHRLLYSQNLFIVNLQKLRKYMLIEGRICNPSKGTHNIASVCFSHFHELAHTKNCNFVYLEHKNSPYAMESRHSKVSNEQWISFPYQIIHTTVKPR